MNEPLLRAGARSRPASLRACLPPTALPGAPRGSRPRPEAGRPDGAHRAVLRRDAAAPSSEAARSAPTGAARTVPPATVRAAPPGREGRAGATRPSEEVARAAPAAPTAPPMAAPARRPAGPHEPANGEP